MKSLKAAIRASIWGLSIIVIAGSASTAAAAAAPLKVVVNLSRERMSVYEDGWLTHRWVISSAGPGYQTPVGDFHPTRLARHWYSHEYHMSPMPYSIFFKGGNAIHGTYELRHLGQPVSHGCVRLRPRHARTLFRLVKRYGRHDTDIIVRP